MNKAFLLQRVKLALLVWLCAYPMVTIVLHQLNSFSYNPPLAVKTLVLSGIVVPLLIVVVVPVLNKFFNNWLRS